LEPRSYHIQVSAEGFLTADLGQWTARANQLGILKVTMQIKELDDNGLMIENARPTKRSPTQRRNPN
jgi:hypothetical protein